MLSGTNVVKVSLCSGSPVTCQIIAPLLSDFDPSEIPGSESLSMSQKKISGGVAHELPADLRKALTSDAKALAAWEVITPLARNEWICWIESAKKAETRGRRIEWGRASLKAGKRRPCCWPGCVHR